MLTGQIPHAQRLAGSLPALLLAAETLAASLAPGRHGRRRSGQGEQFWQFRDYRGDGLRAIDWRRSARGTRLYVREREWEAIETLNVDIDDRPGMRWRSAPKLPTKHERAVLLGLALAALALRGGERVALARRSKPYQGERALPRLAMALDQPAMLPPGSGKRALFGDFLDPPDEIAAKLAGRHSAAMGGVLVQILDPAECDFPYRGRVLFTGPGAERPEDVPRAEAVREAYQARIAAQREAVARLAQSVRLVPVFHRTDAPPALALAAIRAALD